MAILQLLILSLTINLNVTYYWILIERRKLTSFPGLPGGPVCPGFPGDPSSPGIPGVPSGPCGPLGPYSLIEFVNKVKRSKLPNHKSELMSRLNIDLSEIFDDQTLTIKQKCDQHHFMEYWYSSRNLNVIFGWLIIWFILQYIYAYSPERLVWLIIYRRYVFLKSIYFRI